MKYRIDTDQTDTEYADFEPRMDTSYEYGATLHDSMESCVRDALDRMELDSLEEMKREAGCDGLTVKVVGAPVYILITDE